MKIDKKTRMKFSTPRFIDLVVLLFILNSTDAVSQTDIHQKTVDKFINDFNNNDFEHIYQSFSTRMQQSKTKKYYVDFLTKARLDNGKLLLMTLIEYHENLYNTYGRYDADFELKIYQ